MKQSEENKRISLAECQAIGASLLKQMHDFCVANGLRYFVSGGTMLGAVRHGGFIPWDDDIDVLMLRDDFEKFVATFTGEHCVVSYHLTNRNDFYNFAHLTDTRTTRNHFGSPHVKDMGVCVDIFVMDSIPDSGWWRKVYIALGHVVNRMVRTSLQPIIEERDWRKRVLAKVSKALGYRFCYAVWDRCFGNGASPTTRYVLPFSGIDGNKEIMTREQAKDLVLRKFEDFECYVPRVYDELLTKKYGDYMTPPPVEQRVPRHSGDGSYFVWRE